MADASGGWDWGVLPREDHQGGRVRACLTVMASDFLVPFLVPLVVDCLCLETCVLWSVGFSPTILGIQDKFRSSEEKMGR